jgi:hypothetical protein
LFCCADYTFCQRCQGSGELKVEYEHRVMTRACEDCNGEGTKAPKNSTDAPAGTVVGFDPGYISDPDEQSAFQSKVLKDAKVKLNGDAKKFRSFLLFTGGYGGKLTSSCDCNEFYEYLVRAFGKEWVLDFTPRLAQLIENDKRRKALLDRNARAAPPGHPLRSGNAHAAVAAAAAAPPKQEEPASIFLSQEAAATMAAPTPAKTTNNPSTVMDECD